MYYYMDMSRNPQPNTPQPADGFKQNCCNPNLSSFVQLLSQRWIENILRKREISRAQN